jgi:L-amino acid N-acyltransferase YncA
VEDFRQRIARTLERYPYLVAESADGQALGYAYAGPLKERKAYDWACELSIYVAQDARGRGVGGALYATLKRLLSAMGVTNLNACIGYPAAPDDPYLTRASVEFHTHLGFEWVGRFHGCGYKFGRWYDMVWMEKIVGDHPSNALPLRPVSQVAALLGK